MREQAYTISGTATIAINTPNSTAIAYSAYRSGVFIMPAAFTGATVSFQVSHDGGATWTALYNSSNTLISITIGTGRAYPLPAEAQGAPLLRIVSASNEAAARSIQYTLKS